MTALTLIRPDMAGIPAYIINDEIPDCPLQANELPWSPPGMDMNRYPGKQSTRQLQTLLAETYQVDTDNMLITRGSDDGIDVIMRLFLQARLDSVLQCPPTFSMYAFYARLQQAQIINCPLQENENGFYLDPASLDACWQPNCKLIMLCRPNNPTGELLSLSTVADLCVRYANRSIIVVDEAYIEFSDAPGASILLRDFDNLIVLRTLSKAWGLAGLRIGAVLAQPAIIAALQNVLAPFALSDTVLDLGIQALQNKAWFADSQQRIRQLRGRLARQLQVSPWIDKVYSASQANFLLVKSTYATALADWCRQNGLAIRAFVDNPYIYEHLRITVGNDAQIEQLISALAAFPGEKK